MSSQMYSRYIPPASKKNTPANSPPPVPVVNIPTPKPTPPPTTKDASSTYARYIPPSKTRVQPIIVPLPRELTPEITTKRKHAEFVEEVEAPKKIKKQKKEKTVKVVEKENSPEQDPVVQIESAVIKPKKIKSKSRNAETVEGDDIRHNKLLEKREKSLKKGEKIAKKAAKEPLPEVEEPVELHDLVPLPQPEPVAELPLQPSSASLPSWLANPIRISPTATASFVNVGVSLGVAEGLEKKGFKEAFAVQSALLPLLLPGDRQEEGDFLVSAATGSGKTLAYVLPMIEVLSHNQITKLRGLIVLPTRELVTQAKEVSEMCSALFPKRLRIGTAVGNETFKAEQNSLMEEELVYDPVGYKKQVERLNSKWEDSEYGSDADLCDDEVVSKLPDHVIHSNSKVDILICTPGRLVEHLKNTTGFNLENVQWLVVDEADKLLDQSFQGWVDIVMVSLKKPRKIILSATMTRDVGKLNGLKLYRPQLVVVEGETESQSLFLPALLEESGVKVDDEDVKPLYLMEILRRCGLMEVEKKDSIEDLSEHDSDSTDSSNSDSDSDSSSESDSTSDSDSSSDSSNTIEASKPITTKQSPHGALVFTKSNESAIRLSRLISLLSPSSKIGTLTSTTRRSDRKSALRSFEDRKISILIASDLVSRGLDLLDLANVVNYDVPTSLTSYVHRVGRTARAGKKGHAWTLFTGSEGRWFWNEIGRSEGIRRSGKVERVTVGLEGLEGGRGRYEEALEELARESGEKEGR